MLRRQSSLAGAVLFVLGFAGGNYGALAADTAPLATPAPTATTPAAAAAPTGQGSGTPGEQRTFVTLQVVGTDQGETLAVLRADDVLIPVSALEQAGVHGFKGTRSTVQDVPYVSLASLAPAISYKFDEDALSLNITVAAAYLGTLKLDLRPARPANVEYTQGRSAYINYSLTGAGSGGSDDAYVESGYNWKSNTFYTSINAASSGGGIDRGLTYVQSDNRVQDISRTYGDALAQTGELGGSVFIGGISETRNFNLDPYVVHFPEPTVSGAVTAPAVADVYVNGSLVRQVDLPPGTFNLANVPVTGGSVNTKVVVTDAFGHVQTFSQAYYSSSSVLAPGTSDFQYAAGFIRQNAFGVGDHYGTAALMGSDRVGLNSDLTVGGRFEASAGLVSFGPSADFRLPIGLFHFGAAFSENDGLIGDGLSLGYSYSAPRLNFAIEILDQSPYYANVSQTATSDRTLESFSANIGAPLGKRSSAAIEYFRRADRDAGISSGVAVSDTIQFHNYSLALTGTRAFSTTAGPQTQVNAVVNFTLGRVNASLTHSNTTGGSTAGGGSQTTLQLQGAGRGTFGPSYILNLNASGASPVSGTVLDRTPYGDANLDFGAGGGSPFSDTIRLSGGVGLIGGGVYPMRPDSGAFALVDVPGSAGVHVFVDNQDAGKTNRKGDALVAGLIPYYANTIRIEDNDAQLNDSIQTVERQIAPPNKAGAFVLFPVQRLQALVGTLLVLVKGAPVVPSDGELDLVSGKNTANSIIGNNGEFYLENVPPGTYAAQILFKGGTCAFSFEAPKTDKIMLNLGVLQCTLPGDAAGAARKS